MKLLKDPENLDLGFYKILGIAALIHSLAFLLMGFGSAPFYNTTYMFGHLATASDWMIKFISLAELVFALLYVIPVFLAFRYDLLREKKPKHLLIVLLLEFFVFSMLKFFQYLGGNLLMFLAGGIALSFLIGGSSIGIFIFFDLVLASGSVILFPLIGFILPLMGLGVLIQTLADFFG